ncbi:MAG: XisH family protein [Mojavia pulchra JT2-VF2]|uniref:XisH family protein n=1 Tax=Mojavia pulchra JT2-VF2 TaxID=287848 RepID=A0A951UKQ4_9NOST|nr:XisH family protein [Mojavia pulchra JT2-VF2]
MSARDLFHKAVKNALQKENWIVTDDPLEIEFEEVTLKIDLGAERLIAAEKEGEKIAVEIKSFASNSAVSDFHTALGQFLNYQIALEENEPERRLYLAIPVDAHETFFQTRLAQIAVRRHQLKLIIYDPIMEVIVGWTN